MNQKVPSAKPSKLDEVIAAYLHAVESGQEPDRDEWLLRHADVADGLRAFFANLDGFDRIAAPLKGVIADASTITSNPADTPTLTPNPALAPTVSAEKIPSPAPEGAIQKIFGDYELLDEIARGGMGVVYKARQVSLNRIVALKMILSGQLAGAEDVKRFRAEAEAAGSLDHPNIVPIYEIGEHDGHQYFSMKLVEGGSLSKEIPRLLKDHKAAAKLLAAVARAVHFAHQRGILHRDLKPANILLDKQGQPHVTDFGLAKRVEGKSELTQTGAIVGTPAYMPPEQASGQSKRLTTAADVYSLGAVMYELLTGRAPFKADTALGVLMKVKNEEPEAPHNINPKVDRDLETICLKCLEKEPQKRYGSAEALAEELERWLKGEPLLARPATAVERAAKWSRRHPARAALIAVSALALMVLTAGGLWYNDQLRAALKQTEDRRKEAEQQRRKALDNEQNARQEAERARRAEVNALVRQADAFAEFANRAIDARALYLEALKKCDDTKSLPLDIMAGLALWHERFVLPVRTFSGHTDRVTRVAFSPDGKLALSASCDNTLKLWNLTTGKELRTFKRHTQYYVKDYSNYELTVAFSPDGKQALSGSYEGFRLWDIATGNELRIFRGHNVTGVAFSPDGSQALSCDGGTTKLWDLTTGKEMRTFRGPTGIVVFSLDGKLALSADYDKTVKLWNLTTGKELRTFSGHTELVLTVAFSPDGKQALSGSHDKTLKLWDLATGKELRTFRDTDIVTSVAYSPDGKLALSGRWDSMLKLWDLATGKELRTFGGHTAAVGCVAFSPDGKQALSGSWDKTVKLWDIVTDRELRTFSGHTDQVLSVAISPDGTQALSAGGDGDTALKLWDLATGKELRTFKMPALWAWSVAISPDGKQALSGGDDSKLKLWDLATGKELRTFSGHTDRVRSVAFSLDGRLVLSASDDKMLKLWDFATGKEVRTFSGHTDVVLSVAISPDGKHALSGSRDMTLKLWDLATGEELRTFKGHTNEVTSVAFSPDGERALSAGGSDQTLKLWDLATGKELCTFSGHTSYVSSVAFSTDGKHALSGGWDALKLWDPATGKELRSISGEVNSVAFSPDGRQVLSGNRDRTLKLWDFTRPLRYLEFEKSVPEAEAALQKNADDTTALNMLGEWNAFRGVNDWAVEKLEAARAGGAEISALTLARCYWQLENLLAAAKEFQRELDRVKALPVPKEAQAKQDRESEELHLVLCLQAVQAAMDKSAQPAQPK